MAKRVGKYTIELDSRPLIIASGSIVGDQEGEGPLGKEFDEIYDDVTFGEDTWEKSESALQGLAIKKALEKSGKSEKDIDMIFAGDLLDQCIGSTFGVKDLNMPFVGVYGACSTMALSTAAASIFLESGAASTVVAATSSHFCSAEKQFRFPLEYGGQRTPTAQRTVVGAGALVIERQDNADGVGIQKVIFGKIMDLGIKDANNMGAAMAPAAADTIFNFLQDTGTQPSDYDMIVTGDLGKVGSQLLDELMVKDHSIDISSVHKDCGLMIYDLEKQDVHAGGSGCGCSGSVLSSVILKDLQNKKLNKVLFVATGALMSPVSTKQGQSIPAIAHGVYLTSEKC